MPAGGPRIEDVRARAYAIPTDLPEADGTFAWSRTTMVLVEVDAGGHTGLGVTYEDAAAAQLVVRTLRELVVGEDAFCVDRVWDRVRHGIRNIGNRGLASAALSAIDLALWDLKAKLLELPLARLLGLRRDAVPLYGSGGFTTYTHAELQRQLGGWAAQGLSRVKMKIGTHPQDDPARVQAAREAIGGKTELFVDANGAFSTAEALQMADRLAPFGVTWFEEPVSSDDRRGLREVRSRAPPGMAIAAGEYGWAPADFRDLLLDEAVDVLQADATRCGGITGFLLAAALCEAFGVPLSAHTAPAMHLHVCLAAPRLAHLEYFHDHVRIERMLFDGLPQPMDGSLRPDLARPGNGLAFRRAEAERFAL